MFTQKGRSSARQQAAPKPSLFVVDVAHLPNLALGEPLNVEAISTVSLGAGDPPAYSAEHKVWATGRANAWNKAADAHRKQFGLEPWVSLTCLGMREDRPVLTF